MFEAHEYQSVKTGMGFAKREGRTNERMNCIIQEWNNGYMISTKDLGSHPYKLYNMGLESNT